MHITPTHIIAYKSYLAFIFRANGGFFRGADDESAATAARLPGRSRKREK